MGAAFFYHLTRRPLAETLMMLASKSRANGWTVVVRGQDMAQMQALDVALWRGPDDGFLPHGLAGGPHDADQPILLTTSAAAPNAPDCLMSVGGAEITAEEVAAHERVCILFDGNDEAALEGARAQWRVLKDAGASAQYWSEESGSWEKKAET
ncbi:DNA polymerase III subunit chi [Sulfitobacter sp. TSTF-M16]|uniref:DNA polymerase III subunit chi n=1 Tax=Sulfitobacter aestuariivivens TaxID=2766981 RepID=A0A927D526_9RHOB|nr:DNA polymerase III subunit chi [Sulfitobacter aestuariivivens]MBD3663387.1 DNA polymerase III subunit chi [Sulfitobacter aestuariivivens]